MSVVFSHGDKGGVGKSFLAATYGEYVLSKGRPLVVIETDKRNPDIARYFKGAVETHLIDLANEESWVELFTILGTSQVNDILISLAGNSGGYVGDLGRFLLPILADLKRSLAILFCLNRDVDSVALLKYCAKDFSGVPIVAVRNTFHGEAEWFKYWDDSQTRIDLLSSGGSEILLPRLLRSAMTATFGAIPAVRFGELSNGIGERLVLKQFLDRAFAAFDNVADLIGVGAP